MKFRRPKTYHFKQIDSTNTAAFRYAQQGVPSGCVFVADYQTHGRGKWGRKWDSPPAKNLLFSILFRPELRASRAPGITQVACRSVAKVLEREYKLSSTFKRPNDVMMGGKKICGVLVEAKGQANGKLESLVVGIGLNVNTLAKELVPGATSLREVTGKRHSRRALLKVLLIQLKGDLCSI